MKTLKDIAKCNIKKEVFPHECGEVCGILTVKDLKQEAIKILKQNKEINTADWVEFFNIEKEFADAVLGADE